MNSARPSLFLTGCMLVAGTPGAFAQDAAFLDAMLADVKKLEYASNAERGDALRTILRDRGVDFTLEEFEIARRGNYPRTVGTNIVVSLGDGLSDIVVGGHYDTAPLADGSLSPGAVDNAASSIVLTRVAEALLTESLEHRVQVVFFDMEEIGLLGSRDFVQRRQAESISAAINLDINGYGDTLFYPLNGGNSQALSDSFAALCLTTEVGCRGFPNYPASDYLSFEGAGIPNLSLAILPEDEVDELYLALNRQPGAPPPTEAPAILQLIHSADDRSELVDPAAMAITYRAVLGLVRALN